MIKVMGLNYTKVSLEKFSGSTKQVKINNSLKLINIKKLENSTQKTEGIIIEINFEYNIDYQPNLAKINFIGGLIIYIDTEAGTKILEDWKKQEINDETKLSIFNIILKGTNLKAAKMEDEYGLPIHFKIPSLKLPKKE